MPKFRVWSQDWMVKLELRLKKLTGQSNFPEIWGRKENEASSQLTHGKKQVNIYEDDDHLYIMTLKSLFHSLYTHEIRYIYVIFTCMF